MRYEHVHHMNGNKQDNRPDNLEVLTDSQHRKDRHGRTWDVAKAHELRKHGKTFPEIADILGMNLKTLYAGLVAEGNHVPRKIGRWDKKKAARLLASGKTACDVAATVGTTVPAIRWFIKKHLTGKPR